LALGARPQLVDQRLRLDLALAHVVERHVRVEVCVRDETVVGDHRHVLLIGLLNDRRGRLDVDGVQREHVGAIGERGFGLRLLLLRILRGIRVDHLAARAVALDLGLERGPVVGLVARGLGLGQEQGDRLALGLPPPGAARLLVVAAACGQPDDREERHRCRDEARESSLHRLPPQWVSVFSESPAGRSGSSPRASASSSASCWARTTAGMTASASGTASPTASRATCAPRVSSSATSSRTSRAAGPECSKASTGTSRSTAAIGPWRKSAVEIPSATIRAVSLILSAASSAAAWRSPRATTNSRSAPASRSPSTRGSARSASSVRPACGSAARSPAENGAGPSAA